MPYSVPSGALTKANHAEPLTALVNANETAAASARSRADAAYSLAEQKYTLPAGGVAKSSLSADVRAILDAAVVATNTTTRPANAGTVLFTGADPGTNALAGVDLWIGEPAP